MGQVKIVIDKNGYTHIWINGKRQTHVIKLKLETRNETGQYPVLEIKKEIFPAKNDKVGNDFNKLFKKLTGEE